MLPRPKIEIKNVYISVSYQCDQVTDVGRVRHKIAIHRQFRLVYSKLEKQHRYALGTLRIEL